MEVFTIFLVDPSLFSIFQFFATHSPFSLLALWFLILLSRRSLALDLSVVSIVSRMAYSTESLFFFRLSPVPSPLLETESLSGERPRRL